MFYWNIMQRCYTSLLELKVGIDVNLDKHYIVAYNTLCATTTHRLRLLFNDL